MHPVGFAVMPAQPGRSTVRLLLHDYCPGKASLCCSWYALKKRWWPVCAMYCCTLESLQQDSSQVSRRLFTWKEPVHWDVFYLYVISNLILDWCFLLYLVALFRESSLHVSNTRWLHHNLVWGTSACRWSIYWDLWQPLWLLVSWPSSAEELSHLPGLYCKLHHLVWCPSHLLVPDRSVEFLLLPTCWWGRLTLICPGMAGLYHLKHRGRKNRGYHGIWQSYELIMS